MGTLFRSYNEARSFFLARREPLESFWEQLPDDPAATLRGWLIVPPPEVKERVSRLVEALAGFDWIDVTPEHFLHVWVGPAREGDVTRTSKAWRSIPPFVISYRRASCFHDAVIVEAHTDGVRKLAESALPHVDVNLLPHMSVGYVRRPGGPNGLRRTLTPFRDLDLAAGIVRDVHLCEIPIAKSTFLQPWRVVDSVRLD
jgi:2'-5' RNA ligase